MTDEQKLLSSFRAMDDRAKQESLVRMDRIARQHPAKRAVVLRLVGGSAGKLAARSHLGGGVHDLSLPARVSAVVKVK